MLNVSDSGIYQCAAENKYQTIYANAELRVLGEPFIYIQKIWNETLHAAIYMSSEPDSFPVN